MSRNAQFKITLGVLPSYGSTKIGLEIDGISKKNGPAANAGIKKGDVIKSIDGKTIKDIYEYMDRLSELEIGTTVPITIERGGKILTLSISF
jgi:S1-C subfamily serine protease